MTTQTFKKGQAVKIELLNGKKFDLIFVDYSTTEGIAWGKFKNTDGEVQTKPFSLSSVINNN